MRDAFWMKYWPLPLFDAEKGDGSDGPDGDQGGDQGTGDESTGGELYRPDGLGEEFHGESDNETIDKLLAAVQEQRPQLPEDVTGYEFTPTDELKDYFGSDDDPLLNAAKEAALKNGIAPDAFQNFINDTFKDPVSQGIIMPPFDPKREMDSLASMIGGDVKAAEKAVNDAEAVAGNIAKSLKLPEGAAAFFEGMAETASGVMVIRAVQGLAKEKGIALGGDSGGSSSYFSKDELAKMGDDQRLNPNSAKFDADFVKKYDASYQHHYAD